MLQVARTEPQEGDFEAVFLQTMKTQGLNGTFITDLNHEQRLVYGEALVKYMDSMKQKIGSILQSEVWVKEKVAKSIEYYLKRIELIRKLVSVRDALGDAQIKMTLHKDNFGILQDFSQFVGEGKMALEPQ